MVVNQILLLWALLFGLSTVVAVILLILSVRIISNSAKLRTTSKGKKR